MKMFNFIKDKEYWKWVLGIAIILFTFLGLYVYSRVIYLLITKQIEFKILEWGGLVIAYPLVIFGISWWLWVKENKKKKE